MKRRDLPTSNDEPHLPRYIGVGEMGEIINRLGMGPVAHSTRIEWIKRYDLGRKIGGRWKVDRIRFAEFLKRGLEDDPEENKKQKHHRTN